MKKYIIKIPQEQRKIERCHYSRKGNVWKPKQSFKGEEVANKWLQRHIKMKRNGYVSYKCSYCGKWHIGHKTIKIL